MLSIAAAVIWCWFGLIAPLGQVLPPDAAAQESGSQQQTATTTISIPASQPTSQPAVQLTVNLPPEMQHGRETIVDALSKTTLMQVIEGKRTLTFTDIIDPRFWQETVNNLIVTLLAFIPRLLGTILFLFVFWLIYRGIRRMAVGGMKKSEVDNSIRDMLSALIKWCVMGFGLVIACNQLGIPIVAMLTGVSIIGLAVGFAAQETLANFIAGIVIFLDKPFKVGDWVMIDGTFGRIRRVSFRSTRMLTQDGEVIVLPNTQVLSKQLSNHSTNPLNRVNIPIGIAYRASIDSAREVLLNLASGDLRIAKEPVPEVVVAECASSSVNLLFRFWIADEAVERQITYEYLERAKKALDAAGIEIPFPHLQLMLEQTPAVERLAARPNAA